MLSPDLLVKDGTPAIGSSFLTCNIREKGLLKEAGLPLMQPLSDSVYSQRLCARLWNEATESAERKGKNASKKGKEVRREKKPFIRH